MALYQAKIQPLQDDHLEGTNEITPYLLLMYRGLYRICMYIHSVIRLL